MSWERLERFSITSEAEQVARVRSWLWTVLLDEALPRDACAALVLAAGELCNNSIRHAYGGDAGRPIHVSVRALDERLVIEVEDFGVPFDASRYVPPDFESVPDHGMGIFLVNTIADRVSVDVARQQGTRWTLTKYRPGHVPAAKIREP